MIKEYFQKLKNLFGYSHPGNIKTIQKNFEEHRKIFMFLADINLKIISDFRSAYMNIIAGMIAFLGFLAKDGIVENGDFKMGIFFLLVFIFLSIPSILGGFYYDSYIIREQMKALIDSMKLSTQAKEKVKKLEFNKNEAEKYNPAVKNIKIDTKKYLFYLNSLISFFAGISLMAGLFFILKYFYSLF